VGFPCSGLPVGEDGTIITFDDGLNDRERRLIVELALCGFKKIGSIEGELWSEKGVKLARY